MLRWRDRFGEFWTAIVCISDQGTRFVELRAADGFVALSDLHGRDIEPDDNYREVEPTDEDRAAMAAWEGRVAA